MIQIFREKKVVQMCLFHRLTWLPTRWTLLVTSSERWGNLRFQRWLFRFSSFRVHSYRWSEWAHQIKRENMCNLLCSLLPIPHNLLNRAREMKPPSLHFTNFLAGSIGERESAKWRDEGVHILSSNFEYDGSVTRIIILPDSIYSTHSPRKTKPPRRNYFIPYLLP